MKGGGGMRESKRGGEGGEEKGSTDLYGHGRFLHWRRRRTPTTGKET